jgi:hypothetical protein
MRWPLSNAITLSVFDESRASWRCIARQLRSAAWVENARWPWLRMTIGRSPRPRACRSSRNPAAKSSRVLPSPSLAGGAGAASLGESTKTSPSTSGRCRRAYSNASSPPVEWPTRIRGRFSSAAPTSACMSSTFRSRVPQRQARTSLRPTPALSNAQKRTPRASVRARAQAWVGIARPPSAKTTGPFPLQETQRRSCGATSTRCANGANEPLGEHPATTTAHIPRQTALTNVSVIVVQCLPSDSRCARVTFPHTGPRHVRSAGSPRRATPRGGQQPPLRCRDSSGIGRAFRPETSTRVPHD